MRKLMIVFVAAAIYLCAAISPGTYLGSWSGSASGDFRLKLIAGSGNEMQAEVVFTLGTDEVKAKVISVKINGDKLDLVYQYDLQGTQLQSHIIGELKGKTLEGTYKASTVADGAAVDEGSWKASVQ